MQLRWYITREKQWAEVAALDGSVVALGETEARTSLVPLLRSAFATHNIALKDVHGARICTEVSEVYTSVKMAEVALQALLHS
jgi:hypothetical protein